MKLPHTKTIMFLFAAVLMIQSCQKDIEPLRNQEVIVSDRSIKRSSIDQLVDDPTFQTVSEMVSLLGVDKGRAKKGEGLPKLYLDSIIKIVKPQYTTYTYHIEESLSEDRSFSNLVIVSYPDKIEGYVMTYRPSVEFLLGKRRGLPVGFTGEISYTSPNEDIGYVLMEHGRSSKGNGGDNSRNRDGTCLSSFTIEVKCASNLHWPGQDCIHAGTDRAAQSYSYNYQYQCSSGGGGGTIGDDPGSGGTINPGDGSGGGGGGNTSPNIPEDFENNPDVDESPPLIDLISILNKCVALSSTQNQWLLNNDIDGSITKKALIFTDQQSCSLASQRFVREGVNAEMFGGEVDFDEEVMLDSSFENNSRLKCVYNHFKEGNNTVSNYLENFLGEKPVAHLKLIADNNFQENHPNSPNAGAATKEPQNYIIEISFNTDPNSSGAAQNFPTIVSASDLIHEMLHAEMFRKLLSVAQLPEIPWSQSFINENKDNFPTLTEYYLRWKYGNPAEPAATAQHQLMADYYRNMIITALKDFDNNAHNSSFYETLSWSGLVGTVSWNNLNPSQQSSYINQFNTIVQNETHGCNN